MPNFARCRYNIQTRTDADKPCKAREDAVWKAFSKSFKKKCLAFVFQLPVKSKVNSHVCSLSIGKLQPNTCIAFNGSSDKFDLLVNLTITVAGEHNYI
jgi:hypothetical protein